MKLNSVAGGLAIGLAGAIVIGAATLGLHVALNNSEGGNPNIKSNPVVEFVNPPMVGERLEVQVSGQVRDIEVIRLVDREKGVVCYLRGTPESRPMECLHDLSVIEKEMTPSEEELAWMNSEK